MRPVGLASHVEAQAHICAAIQHVNFDGIDFHFVFQTFASARSDGHVGGLAQIKFVAKGRVKVDSVLHNVMKLVSSTSADATIIDVQTFVNMRVFLV